MIVKTAKEMAEEEVPYLKAVSVITITKEMSMTTMWMRKRAKNAAYFEEMGDQKNKFLELCKPYRNSSHLQNYN